MSKVLIFRINSNETSIVPVCAVGDKRMLTDSERCGKVKWMGEGDAKKRHQEMDGLCTMGELFLLVVSRMCFSFISSRYSSVSEISFILYGI
jgi:hypothetical protein